jgi:hypothetical protein
MIEIDLPKQAVYDFKRLSETGNKIVMKNASIIEEDDSVKSIIQGFVSTESFYASTLFNHTVPFAIHSDLNHEKKSILLCPIQASEDQTFIVFDQTLQHNAPMSWIHNIFDDKTDKELKEMYYHTSLKCRPCDTPEVKGCTNSPISSQLFKYLPFTRDLYYGLTGKVWKYKPGKALLFDANRLHATGRMSEPKIGCTIQFTSPISNLEISTKTRILP